MLILVCFCWPVPLSDPTGNMHLESEFLCGFLI
uniref:Uncharacterized protein n=1 Tax=Rhizophora mucronata TaxID=61149 RepID=A0A2P2PXZ9_RHIMU